jgi:bifunctional NMN adenylyltransferase/nudix hydrolase
MQKQYNVAVVIGRFQPVHLAHKELFDFAHERADKVIVIIGSANQPRTFKNPFTADERASMIHTVCADYSSDVITVPNIDTPYNDQSWVSRVQRIVHDHSNPDDNIVLIGHDKDQTTHYLKLFPQWDRIEFNNVVDQLNATDIRNLYFKDDANLKYLKYVVPSDVLDFLDEFKQTSAYQGILEDKTIVEKYKQQYAGLAYPPIFVTTDVVLIQSGHILMIERKSSPGAGQIALPGGFVGQDEFLIDAAIRELKEETKIKVPVSVLKGSITKTMVFDYPTRSSRGRTITHAYLIELKDGPLEKVKGSDDAKRALWVPLSELDPSNIFEDHMSIIQMLAGV